MVDLPIGIILLPLTAFYGLRVRSLLALWAPISEVPLSSTVEARSPTPTVWSDIVTVQELELDLIVQAIQEQILFPSISAYIFRCVPRQLGEPVEILSHYHASLL